MINSLKRSRVCGTGATPGFTKTTQEIHLDKHIKLLDSPGIVFARTDGLSATDAAQVALRNCIKPEDISDPILPVQLMLQKCSHPDLCKLYNITAFADVNDFLINVARARGRIRRGGLPDTNAAALLVLSDWNQGRIPYYTVPPQAANLPSMSHVSSKIVSSFAKEFDIEALLQDESEEMAKLKKKEEMGIKMMCVEGDAMNVDVNDDSEEEESGEEMEEDEMIPALYEDSEEEEEGEAMSEDSEDEALKIMSRHVSMPIKPTKSKKQADKVEKQVIFTEQEEALNPRMNQKRKKDLKKEKKKAKKGGSSGMEEDYDFGEFYSNDMMNDM